MERLPPESTLTYTRFPYPPLFRSDRNTASINQREDSPPTENFSAQIWQSGDDGQSSIDQDGDNSWAQNDQQGNFDVSTIVQTGSGHRSEEHTSELQSLMRI